MAGQTGNRHMRVGEAIREVLANRITRGLKTPGVGFCTITGVDVTKDLAQAKVFVSVFGPEKEQEATLAALRRAAGYLRGEVGREVRMRGAPTLLFVLDTSVERGARVGDAINRARAQDAQLAALRGEAPPDAVIKSKETAHGEDQPRGEAGHVGDAGEPPAR